MRTVLYLFFLLISSVPVAAPALVRQAHGGDWEDANANVFLDGEVTRVDVTIDPADLDALLANPQANDYKNVTVRWRNSVIDETHTDIAFRVRGNTSRVEPRKSFKLDFREFAPTRDFHGLEEVNLNGSSNDPTIIRTMIAWELISRMGLPGSRTHLTALYFNGEFWSLQTHVEHYDEEFAENWFTDKDGNFYKCLYQGARADLTYVPGEDYVNHAGGEVYREFNNDNDPMRDYSDIAELISFINFSSDAVLLEGLEHRIDVDSLLRYLALNVGAGAWDDYWYGSNNFYLYFNPIHDRFHFIPYDYDNSLGTDFFGTDWANRYFENWGDGGYGTTPAPLVEALFSESQWRRQYRRYLLRMADLLEDAEIRSKIAAWHALVVPYMDGTIESGGTVGTQPYFESALTVPSTYNGPGTQDGHRMGVLPYMDARAASLRSQIGSFWPTPDLPQVRINEVMMSNSDAVADEFGEFDDWIELTNIGDTLVDLSGWSLSDTPSSPTKYLFPAGTQLAPGAFIVVWADDTPAQGPLHAAYQLSNDGEHIALFHNVENGRVLVDDMVVPTTITNQSHGRFPDGDGDAGPFANPTPGAANDPTPGGGDDPRDPPPLFINEFMADNDTAFTDEAGDFEDWVEIYNAGAQAFDLSGLHLTDDAADPAKWAFPAGTSIPAGGFVLVWADDEAADGPLHASFALSRNGEFIGLFDNEANAYQEIDAITFGPQGTDVSSGRMPDGSASVAPLSRVSPGASNNPNSSWLMR